MAPVDQSVPVHYKFKGPEFLLLNFLLNLLTSFLHFTGIQIHQFVSITPWPLATMTFNNI